MESIQGPPTTEFSLLNIDETPIPVSSEKLSEELEKDQWVDEPSLPLQEPVREENDTLESVQQPLEEDQAMSSIQAQQLEEIRIHRVGDIEQGFNMPIRETICKKTLCQAFEENLTCDIRIFNSNCEHKFDLILEESSFTTSEPGNYIVVFSSEDIFASARLTSARLKVLSGLAPDVLTVLDMELGNILVEHKYQKLQQIKPFWETCLKLVQGVSQEAVDIFNEYKEEYLRTQPMKFYNLEGKMKKLFSLLDEKQKKEVNNLLEYQESLENWSKDYSKEIQEAVKEFIKEYQTFDDE